MTVETIAKEYIRRQVKHGIFHDELAACCLIVIEPRLVQHQRGIYHMALSNNLNLAPLRRAVDIELAQQYAVFHAERLLRKVTTGVE